MLFAVDIDGTIAARHMRRFARVCNERFELRIEQERFERLGYKEFLRQPELIACKERIGESHFLRELAWIDLEPQLLTAMRPLPGAVDGITYLAQLGEVVYYTARKSMMRQERNEGMAQATYQWLAERQFPSAEHVVFCTNAAEKLTKLAEHIKHTREQAFLIDDRCIPLLEAASGLDQHIMDILRDAVALVAFGTTIVPEQANGVGIKVLALPSWHHVQDFITDKSMLVHFSCLLYN